MKDTFTGTAGATLQSRNGELGAVWTKHPSYVTDALLTDANRLRGPADATTTAYTASGVPPGVEYDVVGPMTWLNDADLSVQICGRMDVAANTFYMARYRAGATDAFELFKFVAGVGTSLGTFAQALAAGQTAVVKLEIRTAAKKVFVDGVERISSADDTIVGAGTVGVRVSGASSDTTGQHLDGVLGLAPGEQASLSNVGAVRVPSIPTIAS